MLFPYGCSRLNPGRQSKSRNAHQARIAAFTIAPTSEGKEVVRFP
jgi:hypothetical protein